MSRSVLPTDGVVIDRLDIRKCSIEVCDVGGQDKMRQLWQHYIRAINALVFVVDCHDDARLGEAKTALFKLDAEQRGGAEEFALVVMANKQDIEGAVGPEWLEEYLEVRSLRTTRVKVFATSARSGQGLKEAFKWLVKNRKCSNG